MSHAKAVKRLAYLAGMLSKYAHRWYANGEPSDRMYAWVDEYTELRAAHPAAWAQHCQDKGYDLQHTAYDIFA